MKRVIDKPQTSDMGSGFGHIEFPEGTTLKEMLDWIHRNAKTWGTVTIFKNCDDVRNFIECVADGFGDKFQTVVF